MSNDAINLAMMGPVGEHDHVWGPVESAHFTGNPHRRCQIEDCQWILLDLYPERDGDPYWVVKDLPKERDHFGYGWVCDTREEADAFAREYHAIVVEYEYADAVSGTVIADYREGTSVHRAATAD